MYLRFHGNKALKRKILFYKYPRDLLWQTLDSLAKKNPNLWCIVCTQELPRDVIRQLDQGFADRMDAFARTSPRKTRRSLWRYAHIKNILTCFTRSHSGGSLSTFYPGRHDLLISIIEFKGRRIGVINCHNTSSSTHITYDFLTSAFAAAIRLQTGGTDSSGQKIEQVDAVVLAGDLNIKNIYFCRNIDTEKKSKLRKRKFYFVTSC
uniref:Endonuclease/exonuclease/phosphatase domain-containing protein n=1 Tax=Tetranychus urticae TaxID=32264 RepID=T1JV22_TETUR